MKVMLPSYVTSARFMVLWELPFEHCKYISIEDAFSVCSMQIY